jgi:hypothetical protein
VEVELTLTQKHSWGFLHFTTQRDPYAGWKEKGNGDGFACDLLSVIIPILLLFLLLDWWNLFCIDNNIKKRVRLFAWAHVDASSLETKTPRRGSRLSLLCSSFP